MKLGKKVYVVKPLKDDFEVCQLERYVENAYDFEILDCKFVNYDSNIYAASNVIVRDSLLVVVPNKYVFTSRKHAEEKVKELRIGIIKKLVANTYEFEDVKGKLKKIEESLK